MEIRSGRVNCPGIFFNSRGGGDSNGLESSCDWFVVLFGKSENYFKFNETGLKVLFCCQVAF